MTPIWLNTSCFYLCDGNKDIGSRIFEKMREWIVTSLSPQLLLYILQQGVTIASKGNDHPVRKQAVHDNVLGHQVVTPQF
jgi:hypothetical protein